MAAIDDNATARGSVDGSSTVFISYSRTDRPRVVPIIRILEEAGFTIWWDGLLEGGERFSQTTEDALDRALAVVVLWSKNSVHSHWVHDEATRGRDRADTGSPVARRITAAARFRPVSSNRSFKIEDDG